MKILHVNKFFDFHGGAEVYLHQLMHEQAEAGHEVHVFSTRSHKNAPSPDEKYFVERFDLDRREGFWRDLKKARNFLWNPEAKRGLARMLADLRPDVVHLHNIYHHLSTSVLEPIRASGIPCVQTLHDYKFASANYAMFGHGEICEHGKNGRYWEIIRYRCLQNNLLSSALAAAEKWMTDRKQSYERTVRLFLCPSHFMKRKMEEWGKPADRLRYVPNPTYLPTRAAGRGGGYVLYAGRLSVEKGLESFLHGAARVPELPVKIAGRGPQEALLRELVKRLHIRQVEFLGFIPPEQLLSIRERAEAVVLPTVSYENASGALLEAMASGLPCLATDIGGNPELVNNGENGFLVRPGSAESWTDALQKFMRLSNEERDRMGEAGRERIRKNHLWSQHVERVAACYQEAGAASS